MATSVGELSFMLKSTYDNAGVKQAEADQRALMIQQRNDDRERLANAQAASAKMREVMEQEDAWKRRLLGKANDQMSPVDHQSSLKAAGGPDHLGKSMVDEQRTLDDRQYWANRARMRDENFARERQTVDVLTNARMLGVDLEQKAIAQKFARELADTRTLAAVEQAQREKAVNRVLAPDSNKAGFMGLSRGALGGLQNAGFMIQDFSSQFSNAKTTAEGLSRGIGAISNNVQMLGAAFGPTGMAVSAIGGGIAGVVLPAMIKWVSNTAELEAQTKAVETAYENLGSTMKGMETVSKLGLGIVHAKDAKKQIDDLKGQLSSLSLEKGLIDQKLGEATKGLFEGSKEERKQAEASLTAWTKRGAEIAKAYGDVEDKLKVINSLWGPSRLDAGLKRDAAELAAKDALKDRKLKDDAAFDKQADQHFKDLAARDKAQADVRAKFEGMGLKDETSRTEAAIKKERDRMLELRVHPETLKQFDSLAEQDMEKARLKDQMQLNENRLELLQDRPDMKPSGSTRASIRGESSAASAINRAIAGARSEESKWDQEIRELKKQNQTLEKMVQKLSFKRAELH